MLCVFLVDISQKPWSQPAVRLFCPHVFWMLRALRFFLNTWVGRGMSREDARHTHGVRPWHTSHVYGVSGCVYRTLLTWYVLTTYVLRAVAMLTWQKHEVVFIVLLREIAWQQEGRRRRWWFRLWIKRRTFFGRYETLFQELERESKGGFVGYIYVATKAPSRTAGY